MRWSHRSEMQVAENTQQGATLDQETNACKTVEYVSDVPEGIMVHDLAQNLKKRVNLKKKLEKKLKFEKKKKIGKKKEFEKKMKKKKEFEKKNIEKKI